MTVAALGTVSIAAGAVLGVGAASGAPAVAGPGASAQLQPADNGFGGQGLGGGYDRHGGGSTATGIAATSAQQIGIVDIDSISGYQNAEAAGTGMVLTSNGDVLTNNHVVDGATSITVTGVQPGDSGGPLYDPAGATVAMDTAASSGGPVQAYAIPISTAEGITTRIEQGATSATMQRRA
jgi:S1-C subfamily serine protease